MITILIVMFTGIIVGYLIRQRPKLIHGSEKMLQVSIYLLLFLLGMGVGTNKNILSNFYKLGYQAVVLTFGAVMGSILVCWLIYILYFRKLEGSASNSTKR